MTYDFYISRESSVHRLDPRVKFALSVFFIIVAFVMNNLLILMFILCTIHVIFAGARIPLRRIFDLWKLMLPVDIMIVILWPIFSQEGSLVLFQLFHRTFTLESVLRGITMAIRITSLGMACFILLLTTDQTSIVLGLVRLGLPYDWGLTFAVTLRYLPTFYGIIGMVTDAQKARGLDLEKGRLLTRARSYLPILVSVIIIGLKASNDLSNALESRAYGAGGRKRSSFHQLRMTRGDYAVVGSIVSILVGVLAARYIAGFGADLLHLFPA